MAQGKVEIGLPGIKVGIYDVRLDFFRRQRKAGPFLIVSRGCGRALDTNNKYTNREWPHLNPPVGRSDQFWFVRPSGTKGEAFITSIANQMALDATPDTSGQEPLVMWEMNREPWQRWLLEDAPDGAAFRIRSAHSRKYLCANEDAKEHPWFTVDGEWKETEWLFLRPHGAGLH